MTYIYDIDVIFAGYVYMRKCSELSNKQLNNYHKPFFMNMSIMLVSH